MCKTRQAVAVTCCILRARTPCIGSLRSRLATAVPSPPRAALFLFLSPPSAISLGKCQFDASTLGGLSFPGCPSGGRRGPASGKRTIKSVALFSRSSSFAHSYRWLPCLPARASPPLSLPFVISFTSFSHFIFFRSRYLLVSSDLVSAFFLLFTLRKF